MHVVDVGELNWGLAYFRSRNRFWAGAVDDGTKWNGRKYPTAFFFLLDAVSTKYFIRRGIVIAAIAAVLGTLLAGGMHLERDAIR